MPYFRHFSFVLVAGIRARLTDVPVCQLYPGRIQPVNLALRPRNICRLAAQLTCQLHFP